MRYRRETATGDYTFGQGTADFYVDEPMAVAQSVKTRLRLFLGEYFPNTAVGMPWGTQVAGFNDKETYDDAIRTCIAGTQGFDSFVSYSSVLNPTTRMLVVRALINTIYSGLATPLEIAVAMSGYNVGGFDTRPYGD